MKALERWAILTIVLALIGTAVASNGPTALFWAVFTLFALSALATTRAQTVLTRKTTRLGAPQ